MARGELPLWDAVAETVAGALGRPFRPGQVRPVAGGDINRAFRAEDGDRRCFVKLNDESLGDMFQAEAQGLAELAAAGGPRVPHVLGWGTAEGQAYLVLEWLELVFVDAAVSARLGEALAALHGATAQAFGWHRDNTIGTTPQPNPRETDWAAFYARHRLGHQLDLLQGAAVGRDLVDRGRRLQDAVPALLAGHWPVPSLLHGDLWGGNAAALGDGTPVVFDPAVHYGDRECDLAMTELFGGFGPAFQAAYRDAWPLPEGYEAVRRDLYQLYHLLNHCNLFGAGYAASCRRVMDRLLAEAG